MNSGNTASENRGDAANVCENKADTTAGLTSFTSPNDAHQGKSPLSCMSMDRQHHNDYDLEQNMNNVLPSYKGVSNPSFMWGERNGESFVQELDECYNEVQ